MLFTVLDGSEVAGLPSDMKTGLNVYIGDQSASDSEVWKMRVGDKWASGSESGRSALPSPRDFKLGESYLLDVEHVSPQSNADYDYRAWVDHRTAPGWSDGQATPIGPNYFVIDSNSPKMLQRD